MEPSTEYDTASVPDKNASKDSLKAVKFMKDPQDRYYLTGVLDVATMDDYTLIDHFDAYTPASNEVRRGASDKLLQRRASGMKETTSIPLTPSAP